MERDKRSQPGGVLIVAHRGAAGYAPENTAASFELAIETGADLLELDVQVSKDGKLVVIHDATVDRTSDGTGQIPDLTLEQLRKLDAGRWFHDRFSGQRIPTLAEVLALSRGRIGLLIEIKWPSFYPGIEQKLADELVAYNLHKPGPHQVIVQSFDQESMKRFHAILPDVPVGVLIEEAAALAADKLEKLASIAGYINPYLGLVTKETVDLIHNLGMNVFVWTVRSRDIVRPLLDLKVDGIITDYPDYIPR